MAQPSKRKAALLSSGTLSPNPWDLSHSGQNGWLYTEGTRTEDKAPQGCDLSADSSAGMATGGFDADAAPSSNSDPSNINLLRAQNGLDKGVHFKQFLEAHANAKADSYTLAIIANVVADSSSDRDSTRNTFIRKAMLALLDARSENGDMVSWTADESAVYSTGSSAAIETTGLATQALLKWGEAPETVRKALNFISSNKQAAGNWGTTQATVMALRALLLASQGSGPDVRGVIHVAIDGKPVETLKLTQENNDLLHQFVFKGIDGGKPASVQLAFKGKGGVAYQVVGRYFTPWEEKPASEPLSIDIAYDRTRLARNDIATATATVRSRLHATANMVMVDLGIPPGFELLSEDLQAFQEKTAGAKAGALEKFSLTATQAILYFNALSPMQTVTLRFRLRAKYPIRARTFQSRVYEYYDPDVKSIAPPVRLEVTEH